MFNEGTDSFVTLDLSMKIYKRRACSCATRIKIKSVYKIFPGMSFIRNIFIDVIRVDNE